jgi:hypothetical protein
MIRRMASQTSVPADHSLATWLLPAPQEPRQRPVVVRPTIPPLLTELAARALLHIILDASDKGDEESAWDPQLGETSDGTLRFR